MSASDATQFIVIAAFGVIFFSWLLWRKERAARLAGTDPTSARYPVTRTSTLFIPKFDQVVLPFSVLYIPCGDGMYVKRVKARRGNRLTAKFREWVRDRKAVVNLLITNETPEGRAFWQTMVDDLGDNFRVYILHKGLVAGPDTETTRSQIESLQTFHPVVALTSSADQSRTGAMWIEAYHAVGSKYAYNVEFVAPQDAKRDPRLSQYAEMYEALLRGAHVERLKPSHEDLRETALPQAA